MEILFGLGPVEFLMVLFAAVAILVSMILITTVGKVISFVYPNAKYNAMGNEYVEHARIEMVLESRSVRDLINVVQSKDLDLRDCQEPKEIEIFALDRELTDLRRLTISPIVRAGLETLFLASRLLARENRLFVMARAGR